jgi:hypothetical protein
MTPRQRHVGFLNEVGIFSRKIFLFEYNLGFFENEQLGENSELFPSQLTARKRRGQKNGRDRRRR